MVRNPAHIASLRAAAEVKRIRIDAASEREHLRLMYKVEHEYDGSLGRGGILKRGLARIKNSSLAVPAERKRQLLSSPSGRSFHGKGSIHQKERHTPSGKRSKKGGSSGAAHYCYIEDEGNKQHAGEAQVPANMNNHVSYIDSGRVETTDNGNRFSKSNIEGDFVERMRFFELTEMFERDSHGDSVTLDLNRPSAEIAATSADPECDAGLREALEKHPLPHKDKPIKIQLKGSNKDLRRLLTKHGTNLSKASKNETKLANDGIAFHTGRSGRTHFRWVFELPVEFTAEQRAMVLEDLGAHMADAKCMYAEVIHAPDPHNDKRNYHLHLIFYDRPCRRLTGTEADLANVAETFKADIWNEIANGQIKKGEWDFTVQRHYLNIRSWKIHYPFRAEKSREITKGKDWKARFRRKYAAIVNGVSAKTGGNGAVYDPRSYDDRNVDITPSKHLGQLHGLEVAGIPTLIGLSNEANQASDERRAILARHEAEMARLVSLEAKLDQYRPGGTVSSAASKWAIHPLNNIADAKRAAEATLAMDLWSLETARERSRATLVRDRQKRASQKGKLRERQQREDLAVAAEQHLATLDRQDSPMQFVINSVQREIQSAPEVTAVSIERTAENCGAISRLFPVNSSESIATLPERRVPLHLPSHLAIAAEFDNGSPTYKTINNVTQQRPFVEPIPSQAGQTPLCAAQESSSPIHDTAKSNAQMLLIVPPLNGPAEPVVGATTHNGVMARPLPTLIVPPLLEIPTAPPLKGPAQPVVRAMAHNAVMARPLPAFIVPPLLEIPILPPLNDPAQPVVHAKAHNAVMARPFPTLIVPPLLENADSHRLGSVEPDQLDISVERKCEGHGPAAGVGPLDNTSETQMASEGEIIHIKPANSTLHEPVSNPQYAQTKTPESIRVSLLVENSAAPSAPINQPNVYAPTPGRPQVTNDAIMGSSDKTVPNSDPRDSNTIKNIVQPIAASLPEAADARKCSLMPQASKNHINFAKAPEQISSGKVLTNGGVAPKGAAPSNSKLSPLEAEERGPQNQTETDLTRQPGKAVIPSAQSKPTHGAMAGPDDLIANKLPEAEAMVSPSQDRANAANHPDEPSGIAKGLPDKNSGATGQFDKDASSGKDASPDAVAVAMRQPEPHDLLIRSFETAGTDDERRRAAGPIRADKVALARMVERENADWIAVDKQFQLQQQQMAAMKGRGIGG
jgi:hypothetical protein